MQTSCRRAINADKEYSSDFKEVPPSSQLPPKKSSQTRKRAASSVPAQSPKQAQAQQEVSKEDNVPNAEENLRKGERTRVEVRHAASNALSSKEPKDSSAALEEAVTVTKDDNAKP